MNQENNPIIDIIERLWKSRELIAEAYHQRSIIPDDSSACKIQALKKSRLLIQESGKESVRLSQKLSRFLDFATRKDRLVEVNANLGEKIGILQQIMYSLDSAKSSNNNEEWQEKLYEFEDELFDITESLDVITLDVRSKVERNFGVATSQEVRKQENQYYLGELATLIRTLQLLRQELSDEPFISNSAIETMLLGFPASLIPFHDRIKETQKIISDYLFQQRQLEEKTQKVRALSHYIRKHPGFYPAQAREVADELAYFRITLPRSISVYPDISDTTISGDLAILIQDIQRKLSHHKEKAKREKTTLEHIGNKEETETITLQEETILYFLSGVVENDSPTSALSFYDLHSDFSLFMSAGLSQGDWLWLLTSYFDNNPEQGDGSVLDDYLKLHSLLEPNKYFTGNAFLKDVYIYPAKYSETHIERGINSLKVSNFE